LELVADTRSSAGVPEPISRSVFSASDDFSSVTGNVLVADGGTSVVDANGAAIPRSFLIVAREV